MSLPRRDVRDVPAVDEQAMREVDRRMVEDLLIDLPRMMENAGRNLAEAAISLFDPSSVLVMYGSGGNGGGGLVAARHLINRGVNVTISPSSGQLTPVTMHQHQILTAMGVLDHTGSTPPGADLVIDAMIGYSLRGDPQGRVAELVAWSAQQPSPVLALDVPTGFSAADGEVCDPHVSATATLTLALPKEGMTDSDAVGRMLLGDISVPPVLYDAMGLKVPRNLFARGPIVELV